MLWTWRGMDCGEPCWEMRPVFNKRDERICTWGIEFSWGFTLASADFGRHRKRHVGRGWDGASSLNQVNSEIEGSYVGCARWWSWSILLSDGKS